MGAWEWDIQGNTMHWSPQEERLYGLEPGTFDGAVETYRGLVHPDDREATWQRVERALAQRAESYHIMHRIVRADGQVRWLDSRGRFVYDAHGAPLRIVGISADITNRIEAQVVRDRQAEMLGAVDVGTWYCDLPFDELIWSEKVKEHFWLPPSARVTIDTFYERIHVEDRAGVRSAIDRSIAEHAPYDIEYRTVCPPDGSQPGDVRWVRAIGYTAYDAVGKPIRFDGITVDVTATKRNAELLAQSAREEAQLVNTLQRIGATLTAEFDTGRIVQTVTDEATKLTGAQFGAFFYNVLNDKGESYMLYALSGVPREAFSKFPMPRNTAVFAPTFHGDGVVRSDDITADARYGKNAPHHGKPQGHLPVVSYLAVPVRSHGGEVIGGLFFGHAERAMFTERHEKLADGIAAWAAVAMDNARFMSAERLAVAESKHAHDRLQEIFEQAPAAIRVMEGPEHVTLSQNAASRALHGTSAVGKTLLESMPNAIGQRFVDLLDNVYKTGKAYVGTEMAIRFGGDTDRYFNVVYQPIREANGSVTGILSHAVDVTEQVLIRQEVERKADELRELTTRLEHSSIDNERLRERAEAALADAEEANRVKGEFLARMSHDLRTPLNAIGGYAELLQMEVYGAVGEQQQDALRRIRRAQEHLLTLINDILSFARLEAGQVSVKSEPVSVRAVFDEVAGLTRPELEGRTLPVTFDCGDAALMAIGDHLRLVQVLLNLVSNAIKFTDQGAVHVVASLDGDRVALRVTDTGRGIPPGRLSAIFDPFVQVRPHKGEDRGGVGLGLAISRELMRLMGGELSVESEIGKGSTFTARLPRA